VRKLRVLITGGGAPGIAGTIYALRNNEDNRKMHITVVDARNDVVGKYLSDSFYVVPKASDKSFIGALEEIVKYEKIDVILPQVTRELDKFASNIERFKKIGVSTVVMKKEVMNVMNNKYELMKRYFNLGYNQGVFKLVTSKEEFRKFAEEVGYPDNPFVVKIPVSNGMRGLRIVVERRLNLEDFLNEKPNGIYATFNEISRLFDEGNLELVTMEFFPGEEYTIDIYRSPLTRKIIAVPRKREVIRTGITFEGILEERNELIQKSIKLAENIGAEYCFGFQFKRMKNGEFGLLESNPRVQGTMIMAVLGGANMIYWAVKESRGEIVDLDDVYVRWGMKFRRFWGGLAILDGEVKKV